MEHEEFWETFLKGKDDSLTDGEIASTDPTLNPGYRAEDKPTTTGPQKSGTDLGIEAILADIRKRTAVATNGNSADLKSSPPLSIGSTDAHSGSNPTADANPTVPVPNRAVTPPNGMPTAPLSNTPPGDPPKNEQDAMREMTAAMRDLTEELRYFRKHMGSEVSSRAKDSNEFTLPRLNDSENPDDSPRIRGEPDSASNAEKISEKKKANKIVTIVGNVLFYLTIVAIIAGAFLIRSSAKGKPFMFAGYSAATILTSSMEDVYPKGTLIITKTVEPGTLKLDDDITFMINEDTSVTHRIVDIIKDPVTGDYLFETKGTNNKTADKDKVSEVNIVGKVVYSSKALGNMANFIRKNWPFLIFVLVVLIVLIAVLKHIFREEPPDPKGDKGKRLSNPADSNEENHIQKGKKK